MTREEEIIEAAIDYSGWEFNECAANNGFIRGAQWADNHPKSPWISVNDDLPCNHEDLLENEHYTKGVLVVLEWNDNPSKEHIEVCYMCNKIGSFNTDFYWMKSGHYTVTHWMRLPELPKE